MKLTSPTMVEALMRRHELHFNKRFGQNFLIDDHILNKIARAGDLTPTDTVIEIGPGIGALGAGRTGDCRRNRSQAHSGAG